MISEETLGLMPAWSSQVAAVWRAAWGPVGARFSSRQRFLTPRWTAFSATRPVLRIAWGGQTLDPPGAPGLPSLLVGGELEAVEFEVDLGPVEDLDLLVARGGVGGQREGHRVAEGLARRARLLLPTL